MIRSSEKSFEKDVENSEVFVILANFTSQNHHNEQSKYVLDLTRLVNQYRFLSPETMHAFGLMADLLSRE